MLKIERLIGHEENYLIDEIGNIISIPNDSSKKNQFKNYYVIVGKISNCGYIVVTLTKNGVSKSVLLHRLVGKQFIPNPNNYPQINHINGIKTDNRVCNLEWCTAKQNKRHAIDNNLSSIKEKMLQNLEKINAKTRYVEIILIKDGIENKFTNSNDAAAFAGCHKDKISHSIKHSKKCRGFIILGHKAHFANEET